MDYLKNPKEYIPGIKMVFADLKMNEREDLIRCLKWITFS